MDQLRQLSARKAVRSFQRDAVQGAAGRRLPVLHRAAGDESGSQGGQDRDQGRVHHHDDLAGRPSRRHRPLCRGPARQHRLVSRARGGFMVLDRDDRGGANNTITVDGTKITSPIRQETVSIRGIVAGEYTVNVALFSRHQGRAGAGRRSRSRRSTRSSRSCPTTPSRSTAWARRRPRCVSGSPTTATSSTSTIATNR